MEVIDCWKNLIFVLEEKYNVTMQTRSGLELIRKMSENMEHLFQEQNAEMDAFFSWSSKATILMALSCWLVATPFPLLARACYH
jgi:hypothetical protein